MALNINQAKIEITAVDKTRAAFDSVKNSMKSMAGAGDALKATMATLGLGSAVAIFANMARSALNAADAINDVAKANEVTVSSVLQLSNALMLNGGEADNASKLFSSLTNKLDEAAGGSAKAQAQFAKVGVSMKDLATLDSKQLFEKTLQGLAEMQDPITRNATAMDLFGKAVRGVDIKGLADDYAAGQGSFNEAEQRFKEIGIAMDKVDKAQAALKLSVAEKLAPWYTATVEFLEKMITGWDRLAASISKARNAGASPFKAVSKITDKPAFGEFNLPAEFQDGARRVIEESPEAIAARNKAQTDKEAANRKALTEKKKQNDLALKDIQDEIDFEQSQKEALYAFESNAQKDLAKQSELEYQQKLKQLDELQQVANENFNREQKAIIDLEDARKKEFEKTVDNIDNIFREGFANMVNGGKDTWDSFTKSLATTFKTTVADAIYKMFAQPFVVKMVASLLGVSASGAASAAGADIFGTSGIAGEGSSFFGGLSDKFNSIGSDLTSYVGKFGDWVGGLDDTGGLMNQLGTSISTNQLLISQGLAFSGAALQLLQGNIKGAATSAAGAGAGLLLSGGNPLGGAIGGALGGMLGSALGFGKKKIPRYDSNVTGTYNASNNSYATAQGETVYKGMGANAQLGELGRAFSQSLNSVLKSFGLGTNVTTHNQLIQKRKNSYANFDASFGGTSVSATMTGSAKNTQDTFNRLVTEVMGKTLSQALQQSKLTQNIKKFFVGITDFSAIQYTTNSLLNLKASLLDMPKVFDSIRNAIDTVKYSTGIDTLKKRFKETGVYTSLFYTEQENLDTLTKQLQTRFKSLNATLPETRDEYRKLVDGIEVTNKKTSKQLSGLVSLAPAMDSYYKRLEAQAEATNAANEALKSLIDNLSSNGFKTLFDFNRYKKVATNYGIDFANANPNKLPSYAEGTSFVPSDMVANIHQGERIIPASDNLALMTRLQNPQENQAALIAEIRSLRATVERLERSNSAENQSTNLHLYSIKQDINQQVNDGIHISDTNLNGTPQIITVTVV